MIQGVLKFSDVNERRRLCDRKTLLAGFTRDGEIAICKCDCDMNDFVGCILAREFFTRGKQGETLSGMQFFDIGPLEVADTHHCALEDDFVGGGPLQLAGELLPVGKEDGVRRGTGLRICRSSDTERKSDDGERQAEES